MGLEESATIDESIIAVAKEMNLERSRWILEPEDYELETVRSIIDDIIRPVNQGVQELAVDSDGDGIPDDGDFSQHTDDRPCAPTDKVDCDDNCTDVPNPEQADSDLNGIGDACDCASECSSEGDTLCEEGTVSICERHKDGCLYWDSPSACGEGFCEDDNSCGHCDNNCSPEGETRCDEAEIVTCIEDENGCLDWSNPITCDEGFCGDDTSCGSCHHQCSEVGTSCDDDGVTREICTADENGCRTLSTETCDFSCSQGDCVSNTVATAQILSPRPCGIFFADEQATLWFRVDDLTGIDHFTIDLQEAPSCNIESLEGSIAGYPKLTTAVNSTYHILTGLSQDKWYRYRIESTASDGYQSTDVQGWFYLSSCPMGLGGSDCDSCAEGYQDHDKNETCHPDCETSGIDCGANGECDDSEGFAACLCDNGFYGAYCDTNTTDWPMYGYDRKHSSRSALRGPRKPFLKWSAPIEGWITSSPSIGADGTIYTGNTDRTAAGWAEYLLAYNPDGTQKWSYLMDPHVMLKTAPAIGPDGTIYASVHYYYVSYTPYGYLYALNSDGTYKWHFEAGIGTILSSPVLAENGTIYFGSDDSYLYALNPDGTLKWSYQTGDMVRSSPAIGGDGTIYFGSVDGNVYAINPDGTLKWQFPTEGPVYASPSIGTDETVYIGSDDTYLYAINPDGTQKWRFKSLYEVRSCPAIALDGTLYIGTYSTSWWVGTHFLYAINPDGTLKWDFPINSAINTNAAIDATGVIYIATSLIGAGTGDPHYIYAINKYGEEIWSFDIGFRTDSSPAIGPDETIYLGANNYEFYAVGNVESDQVGL